VVHVHGLKTKKKIKSKCGTASGPNHRAKQMTRGTDFITMLDCDQQKLNVDASDVAIGFVYYCYTCRA